MGASVKARTDAIRRCREHVKQRMLSYTGGEGTKDHASWLWCEDCGALCNRRPDKPDHWILPTRLIALFEPKRAKRKPDAPR
jgi:hypothetical protein